MPEPDCVEKRGVVAPGWTPPADTSTTPSPGCKTASGGSPSAEELDDDLAKRAAQVVEDNLK
jgi:hypothetical protein